VAQSPVSIQAPHLPVTKPISSMTKHDTKQPVLAVVMIVSGIIVLLGLALFFGTKRQTVQSHLETFRQKLEKELNTPNNDYARHIEDIHVTVTYKGGHVKSLSAKTVDGTDNAGVKGKNISEITFVVTAYWDGLVQSDGYTEMSITWDNQAQQVRSVRYLESNAMFNAATVDWMVVGKALGAMIAYAYYNQ
jgi:hypothetical protein